MITRLDSYWIFAASRGYCKGSLNDPGGLADLTIDNITFTKRFTEQSTLHMLSKSQDLEIDIVSVGALQGRMS